MRMVHNVYFLLHDRSNAAVANLIAACKKYLAFQPGVEFFAAGALAKDLIRPVNDRDWDVGLHMVFSTPEDHEIYQENSVHHLFIHENKESWAKVRIFDSLTE